MGVHIHIELQGATALRRLVRGTTRLVIVAAALGSLAACSVNDVVPAGGDGGKDSSSVDASNDGAGQQESGGPDSSVVDAGCVPCVVDKTNLGCCVQ
jgi:hypothetical protein